MKKITSTILLAVLLCPYAGMQAGKDGPQKKAKKQKQKTKEKLPSNLTKREKCKQKLQSRKLDVEEKKLKDADKRRKHQAAMQTQLLKYGLSSLGLISGTVFICKIFDYFIKKGCEQVDYRQVADQLFKILENQKGSQKS